MDREDVGQMQELNLFQVNHDERKKKKGHLQAYFAAFMFEAKKTFTEKHKEIFVEVIKRAPAGHYKKSLRTLVTSQDQGKA